MSPVADAKNLVYPDNVRDKREHENVTNSCLPWDMLISHFAIKSGMNELRELDIERLILDSFDRLPAESLNKGWQVAKAFVLAVLEVAFKQQFISRQQFTMGVILPLHKLCMVVVNVVVAAAATAAVDAAVAVHGFPTPVEALTGGADEGVGVVGVLAMVLFSLSFILTAAAEVEAISSSSELS
ncbi:hypothetical protein FF38_12268 [Lucilia cuprina]|uniref:Uncharacterized protein n=1 Tax=Lucilia cuprina TaxID=7375 RepID=A0A0L0CUE0_LUCCU|nr:hypothetical protein FF38_12268 [Lucilia cuprina]